MADGCDVRLGFSADCNRNSIPDECELGCSETCDLDLDRCPDSYDCSTADDTVWSEPTAPRSLSILDPTTGGIRWNPPEVAGASTIRYDTLRASSPTGFAASGVCVESDGSDVVSTDLSVPPTGSVFFYLIRAENDCPGGAGTMGTTSAGTPRTGVACTP